MIFSKLPDGRMGIGVADVSGKGVPAALYMTLTKGLLSSVTKSSSEIVGGSRRSEPAFTQRDPKKGIRHDGAGLPGCEKDEFWSACALAITRSSGGRRAGI